uniref:Ig-like domain-containing protein n=1 Tax=Chelydra serpentina TaxID=8475 RepID=A0A8C3RZS8_CHESE
MPGSHSPSQCLSPGLGAAGVPWDGVPHVWIPFPSQLLSLLQGFTASPISSSSSPAALGCPAATPAGWLPSLVGCMCAAGKGAAGSQNSWVPGTRERQPHSAPWWGCCIPAQLLTQPFCPPEPYYMQVLKACELDDATGAVRAVTRYSLNGEDMLRYQTDQNRWFSVHPAAWRVAERWNCEGETFGVMKLFTPQECRFWIERTRDRPRRLVCHVTGFYPRDIEVTWERRGQLAQGEQLTSGILPNGDPTFQIWVSIELGQEGVGPTEHVCVVRHSSLGDTPLRVTWGEYWGVQSGGTVGRGLELNSIPAPWELFLTPLQEAAG